MTKMITKKIHWLLVLGLVGSLMSWFLIEPVTSATVDAWATIDESITCDYSETAVAFGTLTTGSVTTATPILQSTSTTNLAFYHKLYDSGSGSDPGLYSSTGTIDIIGSADSSFGDTAGLTNGVEGYGIQVATTSVGSGGTLVVATRYANKTGDNVGGLEQGSGNELAMASSSASVTDRELNITMKAAVSASNAGGDYKDTLTFTCAASM